MVRLVKVWSAAAICALALSSAWADRLDEIKARGKLIVGVSDTTPPFSFRRPRDNAVAGYDIDLVHGVARRLGVAVETMSLSSAERIPMVQDGRLDLVATSMTRTAARAREVDFSHIYFVSPHAVIVKTASHIRSVRQLAGRKVSSARTSTAGENLKEVVPDADIVYVDNYSVAFAALREGKVDGFATDESVLRAIVRQDGSPDAYLSFRISPSRGTSGSPSRRTSRG
jgi:polar amino acid transport system substrate-binding protein